jgi:hypothetical protein
MKSVLDKESIWITQQFRSGEAMIYDFRSSAGRLTLRVSGRGGSSDGAPAEWGIEAASGTSPEAVVVAEWATTRAESLRAVARSWDEKRVASNLPIVDWDSVGRAMTAVRAL